MQRMLYPQVSSMKTAKPTVNGIEKKSGVLGVTGYSRATWLEVRINCLSIVHTHIICMLWKLYSYDTQIILINLSEKREISRVSVPKDFESGGPKCFAYIDFKDSSSMKRALELK
ncbi:hypothetical protein AAHE18_11G100800 [Arachis hypogaea]